MYHNSSRLLIDRLEVYDFKSYAGHHVLGPFDKSFTAVIGPNGSGKSNVIDALLFVFGKRAKKLRMNRLSEMIHRSAHHLNNNSAKVTVHFYSITTESDVDSVVDGSQFSVSRVVHINNRSEYFLGNELVTFNQIAALLKSKEVDLDNNRFLILQGEVESISQMKPKGTNLNDTGLLEYLEEIIGSDVHAETVRQLSEKVEIVTSEKEGMQRRLKNVQDETRQLEQKKGKAEAYLEKKAKCTRLRLGRHHHNLLYLERHSEKLFKEIEVLRKQIDETMPLAIEAKRATKAAEKEGKGIESRCQHFAENLERAGKAVTEVECVEARLQAEWTQSQTEIDRVAAKLQAVKTEIEESSKAVESAGGGIAKLQSAVTAMNSSLQREEESQEHLNELYSEELVKLNGELTEARLIAAPSRQRMTEMEIEIKAKKAEHHALNQRMNEPQIEIDKMKSRLSKATTQHQQHLAELQHLQQEHQRLKEVSREAKAAREAEKAKVENLEEKCEQAEATVNECQRNTVSLMSQSEKMKAIIDAKTSGAIPGIHGRLGDLGSINQQYDAAISNYCGALDYIVVEAVEDAEAAGQILRDRRLSPLTFLILEKQMHLEHRMQAPFQTPQGSARLFDLVRVQEERVRVAFYFALRDVLVTDTLENATRIAFGDPQKRFNAVTLKGEVLTDVGAMTGGGVPLRGKIRLGEVPPHSMVHQTEAARNEEEAMAALRQNQQELQAARGRYEEATAKCNDLDKECGKQSTEVRLREIRAEQEQRDIAHVQQSLQEKQSRLQVLPNDGDQLEKLALHVTSLENDWNKIQRESKQQMERVESLEVQIENVGNGELKAQREHIQKIKDEISKSGERIAQLQWKIKNAPNRVNELQKNATELTSKLDVGEHEKQTKRHQLENLQQDLSTVKSQREQAHTDFSKEQQSLRNFKTKLEKMTQEAHAIYENEEKLKNSLNDATGSQTDTDRQIVDGEKAIANLQEQFAECLPDEEMPNFADEELEQMDMPLVEHQIQEVAKELEETDINLTSVYQYREKKKELAEKQKEFDNVMERKTTIAQEYEKAKEKRLTEFLSGFHQIKADLKRVYRSITNGGDADLELVDSFDPFSEGIEFSVRPPNKSWKKIGNLSGGEKTLSSMSLIFALHCFRPTPLYVMDEIDAALDFRNVAIVANYITNRTRNAQFIVISLRSQMFDRATELVGIYKLKDCSQSITVFSGMQPRQPAQIPRTQENATVERGHTDMDDEMQIN